jgi:hypothetical protein
MEHLYYTVKKIRDFPVSSRDVTDQTTLPERGIILPRQGESLFSDIPAGDGKIANLFFTVYTRRTDLRSESCADAPQSEKYMYQHGGTRASA